MKYFNLSILILLLFTGCKSTNKFIDKDIKETIIEKEVQEEKKGISASFSLNQLLSTQLEITRFEPIYFRINGRDTVILKEIIYRQIDTSVTKEDKINIDTTSNIKKTDSSSEFIDNTKIEKEFKGYDILKSIIGGFATVIMGPFKWILWLIGLLLIVPIYRFIKRLLTKENKNKI